ncbi:MAG: hypothetical protein HY744_30710 [Deltaproteobacteria bacterium]|nr:hypothetical protein [Deltaproteobacteria bacterium]
MHGKHLAAALPVGVVATLLGGACGSDYATIGLVLRAPQGLLDTATGVSLQVIDESKAGCAADGNVTGSPPQSAVQTFNLDKTGCAAGAAWCKQIKLDQDGSTKVFGVIASAQGQPIAQGCTSAKIDKDPLEVSIKVQRFNPPKCCDDGKLEAGEQCDTGSAGVCQGIAADEVCEWDCLAKEVLLSVDDAAAPFLSNGLPGTKTELALAFTCPASPTVPNALRAVFTDSAADATGGKDVNYRVLAKDLYPVSKGQPQLAQLDLQLRLPLCGSVTSKTGRPREQKSPAIAGVSGNRAAVVYASDEQVPTQFDIYLSAQNESGCADDAAVKVNAQRNSSAEMPDVAGGPENKALVVWQDGGEVRGRIWSADGSFVPASADISIATAAPGTRPKTAGFSGGWQVVYAGAGQGDGDGVFMKLVSVSGTVGAETRANAVTAGVQDQPDVAVLDDGKAIVVWRHAGQIYFQRYGTDGSAHADDQGAPLQVQNTSPAETPAVAAAGSVGSFFAVVWMIPAGDGTSSVWGRFVGGESGFGYNSMTGQNDDFLASHPAIPTGFRRSPAVAVGGDGFVAVGWQDESPAHPGVYVRRFPLPQ